MKFSCNFDSLSRVVGEISSLYRERNMPEMARVVTVLPSGEGVFFGGFTTLLNTVLELGVFDAENLSGEPVQINLNSITSVLDAYKNLSVSDVEKVEFDLENEPKMTIYEIGREGTTGDDMEFDPVVVRLTLAKTNKVCNESLLELVSKDYEYAKVNALTLFESLKTITPTVAGMVKEVGSAITFTDEHIYTAPLTYVAMVNNMLGDEFKNVQIQGVMASYLLSKLSSLAEGEQVEVSRNNGQGGMVEFVFRFGGDLLYIWASSVTNGLDISQYANFDNKQGIAVSRPYFVDLLKRFALGDSSIIFDVDLENGEMVGYTSRVKLTVPIDTKRGDGHFIFKLSNDLLNSFIFAHLGNDFDDKIYLYFSKVNDRSMRLDALDSTGVWHTSSLGVHLLKQLPRF